MSKEVHSGPTDATQARGTPYSGDPEGGAGTEPQPLAKLPLDAWHRARWRADGPVRRLRDARPV